MDVRPLYDRILVKRVETKREAKLRAEGYYDD